MLHDRLEELVFVFSVKRRLKRTEAVSESSDKDDDDDDNEDDDLQLVMWKTLRRQLRQVKVIRCRVRYVMRHRFVSCYFTYGSCVVHSRLLKAVTRLMSGKQTANPGITVYVIVSKHDPPKLRKMSSSKLLPGNWKPFIHTLSV